MKLQLTHLIIYGLIGMFFCSCDAPSSETTHSDDNSENVITENQSEIILEDTPSAWNVYEGTIPCADCAGIQLELRLENKPDKEQREYKLKETYLDTDQGDRTFESSGVYEVEYGLKDEPSAFLIILLDQNMEVAKAFVQETNGDLSLLDQEKKRISSNLNYSLTKK